MNDLSMEQLAAEWLLLKENERITVERRRALEDEMRDRSRINEQKEGTETVSLEGYKVKIVSRIDRKVDSDKLQELAAEHGLTEHLGTLFRWKPEISMTAWKAADASITGPLAGAITAKPGRPSFTIEAI